MTTCTCPQWFHTADPDEDRDDDGHEHRDAGDGCTAPGCACEYNEPRPRGDTMTGKTRILIDEATNTRAFIAPNEPRSVLTGDVPDEAESGVAEAPPIMVTITNPATGDTFSWPISPDIPTVYVPFIGNVSVSLARTLPPVNSMIIARLLDGHDMRLWHASPGTWIDEAGGAWTQTEVERRIEIGDWKVATIFDAARGR